MIGVDMPKKRSRTAVREAQRAERKLAQLRTRLAALEPGGSPRNPIEVQASSQIELRAESLRCPICAGSFKVQEHEAETIEARRLRVVDVKCRHCGTGRTLYFEITATLVH